MTRRSRLKVFALTAVLGVLALLWTAPFWGARLLERSLAGLFKRAVSIERLVLRPHTFEIELRGLRVAGLTPDGAPFIEAPVVRVRPTFARFRLAHLSLSRVRVEGLRLRINAFPDPPRGAGGDDIPKLGGSGRRGLQVDIGRLVVVGGEFLLDHERVPLDLDLPDFRGRLTSRAEGGLVGHFSFPPGRLRMGQGPELPVGTEIDLWLHRGLLTVTGARLLAERTDVAYYGRLRFSGRPQGQLQLAGAIDLAVLERHVFQSGLGFAGAARWDGLLSIDGSRLRLEGRMNGQDGLFMGVAVERFATSLAYDGSSGLLLRDLDVAALGGSGRLRVELPPGSSGRPVRIAGSLRDGDGEGLLRMLFGWGELGIGTAASGELDVSWPRGKARLSSGRVGVDLSERPDGRFPLAGRLDWSSVAGLQSYERADFRGPSLHGRVTGEVDPEDHARLRVEGESGDLDAGETLLVRVRRALGNPEAQPLGVSGAASFRGLWRGTLDWPVFEGRLSGVGVGYAGVDWGRAEWSGVLDTGAETLESRSLVLRKQEGELWWDGRNEIGWLGQRDALDGRLRLSSWPVEDVVKFMEWRVQASGRASGDASVRGRRSDPQGEARITARQGSYYGVPYDWASFDTRWRGGTAEVTAGEARLGGGKVGFRGTLTDDGVYDAAGEMAGVDLGALLPGPVPGVSYGGRLVGALLLQGTLTRPRLRATLRSPRLFLGDEGIGALEAELVAGGDGRVRIDGRCRSGRVDLALTGSVGAAPPYEAGLALSAKATSLDPFLRVVQPSLPAAMSLLATGELRLNGPLSDPQAARAEASLSQLELLLGELAVRASEPLTVALVRGRLELGRFHLAGDGTDLELAGDVDVLGPGPLSLSARGRADLRALTALTPRLRGSGEARLAVDVSGTRAEPRLLGTLDLEGAALRVRGFPHGIEGLGGRVRFSERMAELVDLRGTLAGGQLTIGGQAAYAGGRLTSYDVRPVGHGLALRYPEGARTLLDTELRLFGDGARQWITGTVDVRQVLYSRRYDVASELLAVRRTVAPREAADEAEGAQLDLRVRAPGTLRVDNNLATLAARADLHVQGTSRSPLVTGRAEIERGRLYFQGRTYEVRRGTLDFVNPRRLDPLFEIEAETRIRAYRITLRISGTLERATPTLTSDPPLSSLQILALLAGKNESEVLNLTQTQARESQATLAAAGAATLAAGRLSESVGLEREAQRLFGLSRFSIDPSLLRGANAPTARVTVGKQLSDELSVLYSQDLRGFEERVLTVEYSLSDLVSLLLTRAVPGSANTGLEREWALDVRLRHSR